MTSKFIVEFVNIIQRKKKVWVWADDADTAVALVKAGKYYQGEDEEDRVLETKDFKARREES